MAQSVADILGCPLEYAQTLFEAAGGDQAMAIELGLSGGLSMEDDNNTSIPKFRPPYAHWNSIWPEGTSLPQAWSDQRLDNISTEHNDGIIQPLNGPCGVLSVVQGELWMQPDDVKKQPFDARLTAAISCILTRIVAQYQQNGVIMADGRALSVAEASKNIRAASELVEAAASTAGPSNLGGGETSSSSLVEGPHWLCSSDLMCLLMRGNIGEGNFGAWELGKKCNFYNNAEEQQHDKTTLGLLSIMEINEGIKVADDLKFGKKVWVVHTGDHFMTMRRAQTSSGSSGDDEEEIKLEVYNGLQPVGPITQCFVVSGDKSLAAPAEDVHTESFKKKRPGQPDDIVQARKTDSKNYKDWSFEVVPAVEDPTVSGPLDDDVNEPIFAYDKEEIDDGPWRCASCYANRFKTMNFGQNEAGTTACSSCGKSRREAFWSRWLTFQELSPRMQRRARHMYASKCELLISTLYPKAEIVGLSE